MNTLLSAIVLWLSLNFGLPANYDHPRIAFVSAAEMTTIRHKGLGGRRVEPVSASSAPAAQPSILAVYDDASRTIYLREGWTGKTPAELSVLIHEMVHHLQNLAKVRFACPQEREVIAYRAQEQWLKAFGQDLAVFEIDPFTLLLRTRCAD